MSASKNNLNDPIVHLRESRSRFFLDQLKALGLTTQQISLQTLEELETSLLTVNDAIGNADSFGVLSLLLDLLLSYLTQLSHISRAESCQCF
jgi:hypothetical protein